MRKTSTASKPLELKTESGGEYINRVSREYGLYVLGHRAIPAMTDGLKTGQRIALWLIKDKGSEIKTVSLAGEMISSTLYVHGDKPAGDTISYLAGPYLNNIPLIQGEGQFGTRIAPVEGIGAPRYTEVKRSKFAEKHLYVDLDVLPMEENYDGKMMPETFLPLVPLVLLNGIKGIATGWATNILPRKFEDLVTAVEEVLKTGEISIPLLPHYEKYDVDVIKSDEGPNKYIVRGKLEIKNTSTVLVTELPPDVTLNSFKSLLIDLEEEGRITDFIDNTTDKINIEIKLRRSVLYDMDEAGLIEMFKLRSMMTENIVVLAPGGKSVIRYDCAEDLIKDFVTWRLNWYVTRYEFLKTKEEFQVMFLASYLACQYGNAEAELNPLSESIRELSGRQEIRERVNALIESHEIEVDTQVVEKLIDLPIYRWSKDQIEIAEQGMVDCETKISEYDGILKSPKKQKAIYMKEVKL